MANDEKRIWGIHTQDDNLFLKGNVIAIGWHLMGDLRLIEASRDGFKDKYMQTYPDACLRSFPGGICPDKESEVVKASATDVFLSGSPL